MNLEWMAGIVKTATLEGLFGDLFKNVVVSRLDIIFTEDQLRLTLDKLDTIRLELLRLRAALLPEEELSEEEKREFEAARKEIKKGLSVSLEDLIKEES